MDMKMKFFRNIALLLVMCGIVVVSSCSKTDELLSTVPVDGVRGVAKIDVEKVMKAFDSKVENGELVLPKELTKYSGKLLSNNDRSLMNDFVMLAPSVDVHSVIAFAYDADEFVTVKLTNKAEFEAVLAGRYENSQSAGFDVYAGADSLVWLVSENQAWFSTKGVSVAKTLAEILKKASSENYSELRGVAEYLTTSSDMVAYAMKMPTDSKFLCGKADTEGNVLSIQSVNMESDGKVLKVPELSEINTDFLRYVPGSYNVAFAVGLNNVDWDSASEYLSLVNNTTARMVLATIMPYLKKIDGTVSFAAKIDKEEGFSNVENIDAIAMVHMPQKSIDEIVTLLNRSFKSSKEEPKDGIVEMKLSDGLTLYAGNVDGYFGLSTQPFNSNESNSLATTFQGKTAALCVEMPEGSKLLNGQPYGFKLTIGAGTEQYDLKLSVTGSNSPILVTLLSLMYSMQ